MGSLDGRRRRALGVGLGDRCGASKQGYWRALISGCSRAVLIVIALLPSDGHAARFDRLYGALGVNLFASADSSGDIVQESSGASLNFALGRFLSDQDRVSLNVSYSKFDSSSEYTAPVQQVQSSRVVTVGVTVNAYRTLYERGRISLSAGAGAGYVDAKIRQDFSYIEQGLSFTARDTYQRVSYNVSLHASYRLSPRITLDTGYQVNRETGGQDTTKNTVSLSVRLSMARGLARPPKERKSADGGVMAPASARRFAGDRAH